VHDLTSQPEICFQQATSFTDGTAGAAQHQSVSALPVACQRLFLRLPRIDGARQLLGVWLPSDRAPWPAKRLDPVAAQAACLWRTTSPASGPHWRTAPPYRQAPCAGWRLRLRPAMRAALRAAVRKMPQQCMRRWRPAGLLRLAAQEEKQKRLNARVRKLQIKYTFIK